MQRIHSIPCVKFLALEPMQLKLLNFLSMEEGSSNEWVLCCHTQVENMQALHNFDSIVAAADAVVLSRGNLGLDVAPEKTAMVQKAAINRCNLQGKPVIITRLVDTMVEAPRCTRHAVTHCKPMPRINMSTPFIVSNPLTSVQLHAECAQQMETLNKNSSEMGPTCEAF